MISTQANPILRTLLILVPGLALAVYFGSEIGTGAPLIPILTMAALIFGAVLSALGSKGRVEAALVGFLIFGYFVASRGFAELAPVKPFYVGELGLAAILVMLITRSILARDAARFDDMLPKLVMLYLIYALIRYTFDAKRYGLVALRDLASVYYCVFFYVGLQLGARKDSRRFFAGFFEVTILAQCVIAVITLVHADWLEIIQIGHTPLFSQKGDLTGSFCVVSVLFLATRSHLLGMRWLRVLVILTNLSVLAASIWRAPMAGLFAGSVFLCLAGRWRFLLYPLSVLAGGLLFILAADVILQRSDRSDSINRFQDKIASIIDFSGGREYATDLGRLKANTNEFRTTFWRVVISRTTADNPVFGEGFGYDFLPAFERYYARGGWEGLRSPHNYYVTVYGRMGLAGLILFGGVTLAILGKAYAAAMQVRRGRLDAGDFSYWCCAIAILCAGTFGVVLEGPMGAIPFWTFLGLAMSSRLAAPRAVSPEKSNAAQFRRLAGQPQFPERRLVSRNVMR